MKTITELRDAFAAWPQGNDDNFQHLRDDVTARNIVEALRDPTPITEEGLRELGFVWSDEDDGALLGEEWFAEWFSNRWRLHHEKIIIDPKTIGQLRLLLLGMGE